MDQLKHQYCLLYISIFVMAIPLAKADSVDSLALEQLVSSEGKWRYGLNTIYANSETTGVTIGDDILVQTGPGTFVSIPSSVSSEHVNSDTIVMVPSIRYGLSKDLDIAWRASFSYSNIRSEDSSGEQSSQTFSRFADSWLGLDYRLVEDRNRVNWTVFSDIALAENTKTKGNDSVYGRAYALGLSLYRIYDPIVVTTTLAYQINLSRDIEGNNVDPGDSLTFSPGFSFAPNRDTNLNLGFSWSTRGGNEVNGNKTSIRNTSTRMNMGFAYAWSETVSVFTSVSANISSGDSASFGVSLIYDPERKIK